MPVFKWNDYTSMITQVFINGCVEIYCVLSAAYFNSDKTDVFLKLDTTTLAHGEGLTGFLVWVW